VKRLTLIGIVALCLSAGGCALNKDYVKADKATFDAIAPEYLRYIDLDTTLDKEQKDRRHRTVDSWNLRIAKSGGN
jgi:hypothetical protein